MTGLVLNLSDLISTASTGPFIPVTRGLLRYYLPGSQDFGDLDLAGSGVSGNLLNGTTYNTREAHDILPAMGTSYSFGGYAPGIAAAASPPPPATLLCVGFNGATMSNYYTDAQCNITLGLDVIGGSLVTNTQTKGAASSGYNGPALALDASYATSAKFYAVVQNWVSGGNATQTVYCGSNGVLTSATATQAAIAQSGTPNVALCSGSMQPSTNNTTTSGQRKISAQVVHNVALTPVEVAAHYAQFQRYFNGYLPNNGM
ncbi:hypothetical protein [Novosphingobium sp.]|uniref:hypothetical protein n=1 Tax=Novosphingobium sp. TaxID=1874826 RepID=UPI003B52F968